MWVSNSIMIYWFYMVRRRYMKLVVRVICLTVELLLILDVLSSVEEGGMFGGAVKCLDITKNADCEGSLLDCN